MPRPTSRRSRQGPAPNQAAEQAAAEVTAFYQWNEPVGPTVMTDSSGNGVTPTQQHRAGLPALHDRIASPDKGKVRQHHPEVARRRPTAVSGRPRTREASRPACSRSRSGRSQRVPHTAERQRVAHPDLRADVNIGDDVPRRRVPLSEERLCRRCRQQRPDDGRLSRVRACRWPGRLTGQHSAIPMAR